MDYYMAEFPTEIYTLVEECGSDVLAVSDSYTEIVEFAKELAREMLEESINKIETEGTKERQEITLYSENYVETYVIQRFELQI